MKFLIITSILIAIQSGAFAAGTTAHSQLSENAKILNVVRANNYYQQLVKNEDDKEDTGDVGDNSMRAILIKNICGEACVSRYLILREFWLGHGGANYNMSVLVDINDDSNKILNINTLNLSASF